MFIRLAASDWIRIEEPPAETGGPGVAVRLF